MLGSGRGAAARMAESSISAKARRTSYCLSGSPTRFRSVSQPFAPKTLTSASCRLNGSIGIISGMSSTSYRSLSTFHSSRHARRICP